MIIAGAAHVCQSMSTRCLRRAVFPGRTFTLKTTLAFEKALNLPLGLQDEERLAPCAFKCTKVNCQSLISTGFVLVVIVLILANALKLHFWTVGWKRTANNEQTKTFNEDCLVSNDNNMMA